MEMQEVRDHVEQCDGCRAEQDSLLQTKRLLSSLSYTTPRAELEQLLVVRAERAANPPLLDRILPPEWTDAMLWRWEGVGNMGSPRLRPLAATALLSLAGLCLATASVSRPGDESPFGNTPNSHTFAVYVGPTGTLTRVPTMPEFADSIRRQNQVGISSSLASTESLGGAWQTMATPSLPASLRDDSETPPGWENAPMLSPENGAGGGTIMSSSRPTFNLSVVLVSSRQP